MNALIRTPQLRLMPVTLAAMLVVASAYAADEAAGPKVGVYYYPWYGVNNNAEDQWRQVFRLRLDPPQEPKAGLYRSDDPAVIKEHIAQCRQAGVDYWAVSWWGPGSPTDRTFKDAILPHEDADQLGYAILYESTGRLGRHDSPRYDNWLADLDYLDKTYFSDPQYLKVDGRAVVFVYLTRVYFRQPEGKAALAAAREKFKNLYIVGDDVFGPGYRSEWAASLDAVTVYDVYGQSCGAHGVTAKAVDALASNYATAQEAAHEAGVAFIPAVAPGYNDTVIRTGHPGAARYFADDANSAQGDFFRAAIRRAALPYLDERCGRLMVVTSFNEWFEDSQIEATTGRAGTTDRDDSKSRNHFTAGARYEDYGDKYLDILREETSGERAEK